MVPAIGAVYATWALMIGVAAGSQIPQDKTAAAPTPALPPSAQAGRRFVFGQS